MYTLTCVHCKIKFIKSRKNYKFCSITCANRHNLNNFNFIKVPRKNKYLAEFLGICLGDGTTHTYQVTVSLNSIADKDYHQYVINLIKKLFPTVTISIVKRNFNMVDIKINSKIVAEFMRGMGVVPNNKYVPDWIKTNKSFSNYCVRGLIDTEGSISFKHYKSRKRESVYKQLNFRNYNPLLMNFVHKHLTNLEIKPSVSPKKSLYISNPKSINLYLRIIGFSNPKLLRKVTL